MDLKSIVLKQKNEILFKVSLSFRDPNLKKK